jgi:hypothetical protein
MNRSALTIVVLLIMTSSALARDGDLPEKSRSLLGMSLNVTKLSDIQEKLGKVQSVQTGDAAESKSHICYHQGNIQVIFACDGEMSCPELSEIRVNQASKTSGQCGVLSSNLEIALPNGIALGLTKEKVKTILGAPDTANGDKWEYQWTTHYPFEKSDPAYKFWVTKKEECFGGKEPYYGVSSEAHLTFYRGLLSSFKISRIMSAC